MTAGPKGGPAPKGEVNLTAEKKQATAALPDNGLLGKSHAISPPPLEPPPFTVKDVRDAVPAHLFERSMFWSFFHTFVDLVKVAVTGYAMWAMDTSSLPLAAKLVLWPVLWYIQGAFMTGIWVIAHECGHQAFSASRAVNDAVGMVLHSALLVPYHAWAISHGHHHSYTCSLEDDEVFVPSTAKDYALVESIADTPLAHLWGIFVMLTFGWPGYLVANFSGPAKYRGQANSHYNPASKLFSDKQANLIVKGDIGLLVAVAALAYSVATFGARNVAFYYGVPYLIVNGWLVCITFLQHTDTFVPHFRGEAFTWLRGALATVDRSYGWFLDDSFHHIADSHVAHHLFSTMPWYNAVKATPYIKKVTGDYFLQDATGVGSALWRAWSQCKYVDDEGGVLFYRSPAEHNARKGKKKAL